jgi:hypothetical protein
MTVTALTSPPSPPNGNMDRALFVWGDNLGAPQDPIRNDVAQNALLACCASNGINLLFVDMWEYLGAGNWTAAARDQMKKFISIANASGIRVYALAGNADWGHNLQWVGRNIVRRIAEFNAAAKSIPNANYEGATFDGVLFDVEYYTVEGYNAQIEVPGLCELIRSTRQVLNRPVGVFMSAFAINGQDVTYNGKTQAEGKHIVDAADHVAVGCYSDNAGGAPGSTQIQLFQPWHAYASANPGSAGLWCGSEVGLGTPDGYLGHSRADMELHHAAISAAFAVSSSLTFRGISIDYYTPYMAMP